MLQKISKRLFLKKEGKQGKLPGAQWISETVLQKGSKGNKGNTLRRKGCLSYQGVSQLSLLSLSCLEAPKNPP